MIQYTYALSDCYLTGLAARVVQSLRRSFLYLCRARHLRRLAWNWYNVGCPGVQLQFGQKARVVCAIPCRLLPDFFMDSTLKCADLFPAISMPCVLSWDAIKISLN